MDEDVLLAIFYLETRLITSNVMCFVNTNTQQINEHPFVRFGVFWRSFFFSFFRHKTQDTGHRSRSPEGPGLED
jgi:succinate-acetate transporter protein